MSEVRSIIHRVIQDAMKGYKAEQPFCETYNQLMERLSRGGDTQSCQWKLSVSNIEQAAPLTAEALRIHNQPVLSPRLSVFDEGGHNDPAFTVKDNTRYLWRDQNLTFDDIQKAYEDCRD